MPIPASYSQFEQDVEATDEAKAVFAAAGAAKDHLLAQTIERTAKTRFVTPEEIDILTKGRVARNYVAHESGKIGSYHDLTAERIAEILAALRPVVIDLAKGDNVISAWNLAIQEKQDAPDWMTGTYETRVLNWIFGEPFHGISSWDEWAIMQLAKRGLDRTNGG